MENRIYACIDLKSFYASVECVERGLDPFKTNLAVTDASRGRGAICLAITPAMKELGIRNRCRIFEIPDGVDYIAAIPRMNKYMEYSADVISVYLEYISEEDIHVYSIDECFIDFTPYLKTYGKTPKELASMLMDAVFRKTGICATAGIGTNLFLAKVALDITAKHVPDHIGFLDEEEFRRTIWHHRPITDIWNIGRGTAARLEKYMVKDLYGVAHMSERLLYKEFGVNAEYLIDHAHGIEPCTIQDIHSYKAKTHSLSNSQILFEDYNADDTLIVLREMVDLLVLELFDKKLVTNSISLTIGYSKDAVKSTGGSKRLDEYTNSFKKLSAYFEELYLRTVNRAVPIRRIGISLNNITDESFTTIDFFTDIRAEEKEQKKQAAIISIKNRFGKNAIIKGMSMQEKATAQTRNMLVGGHNAG
ncbi:MAG: DNA repair protein [Oscillospiraceae bacterium]